MRNIILQIIIIITSFLFTGCNGQPPHKVKANKNYIKYKAEFDSELTRHFPNRLSDYPNEVVRNTNVSKNDICFMLYEYDVDIDKIDSIDNHFKNLVIAKYKSNNKCLLIVNRFETFTSHENREVVEIKDSAKINKECYKNLLPIPNFIHYDSPDKSRDIRLTGDFDIYVLEAKSGNHWKEFNLSPNPQMPKEWENGYSRGIALSKEKHTVIYWAIVW